MLAVAVLVAIAAGIWDGLRIERLEERVDKLEGRSDER